MPVFAPLLGCTSATYPRYAGSCGWGYYKLRTNYDVRAHSGEEIMTPPLAPRSPAYSVINKGHVGDIPHLLADCLVEPTHAPPS